MAAMISTLDNPFNPFKDFDKWFNFDIEHHYGCIDILGRISPKHGELPDSYIDSLTEVAVDNFVHLLPNIYYKITDRISDRDFEEIVEKNRKVFENFKQMNNIS